MATKKRETSLEERVLELEEQLEKLEARINAENPEDVRRELGSADLAVTMDALRALGVYAPPVSLVSLWLRAWTPDRVLEAIDRVLATWKAHTQAPGAPPLSPGADWRETAAYLESRQSHLGWSRVEHVLRHGKLPPDPVSMDPISPVFEALPLDAPRAAIEALVPEVLRRAEDGINWAGTQGAAGEGLLRRKALLSGGPDGPGWMPEWSAFRDARLLRVVVLTGVLSIERGLGSYSLHGIDPAWSVEDFLTVQRQFSVPWPGRPMESN